ncbi:MAG: pirin family protein [Bacteroidota bacterium]
MSIQVYPRSKQAYGEFNGGEILENKPIGFPQDPGGIKPFSNIFYWAHAWTSGAESLIAEHPHQGFEIITIVLTGSIKHYDSKLREWQLLKAGDVQIIRAGSGISHAELLHANSSIFQIWFDPDLSYTLNQPASYDNYKNDLFKEEEQYQGRIKYYVGSSSPLEMRARDIEIFEFLFDNGSYSLNLKKGIKRSFYVLEGEMVANGVAVQPHDFVELHDETTLELKTESKANIFVIDLLADPGYKTYAEYNGLT